jgi:hypothetical protein
VAPKKWESFGAAAYYFLGLSFYVYHWLIALGVGSSLLGFIVGYNRLWLLVLLNLISVLLVIGGITAWVIRVKKRLNFLNPDISVVSLVDTYSILGENEYTFEKQLSICALRTGTDTYRCKLRWTGGGNIAVAVEPATDWHVTRTTGTEALWEMLRVQAATPLQRNQTKPLTIRLTMTDTAAQAIPYSQKFVDDFYPNGFTMRVCLPSAPKRVKKEIFFSPRSEIPIYQEEHKQASPLITWRVRKPGIGRRYKIEWS